MSVKIIDNFTKLTELFPKIIQIIQDRLDTYPKKLDVADLKANPLLVVRFIIGKCLMRKIIKSHLKEARVIHREYLAITKGLDKPEAHSTASKKALETDLRGLHRKIESFSSVYESYHRALAPKNAPDLDQLRMNELSIAMECINDFLKIIISEKYYCARKEVPRVIIDGYFD